MEFVWQIVFKTDSRLETQNCFVVFTVRSVLYKIAFNLSKLNFGCNNVDWLTETHAAFAEGRKTTLFVSKKRTLWIFFSIFCLVSYQKLSDENDDLKRSALENAPQKVDDDLLCYKNLQLISDFQTMLFFKTLVPLNRTSIGPTHNRDACIRHVSALMFYTYVQTKNLRNAKPIQQSTLKWN